MKLKKLSKDEQTNKAFYAAKHGFNGNLESKEMVDARTIEGWNADNMKTLQDIANFAATQDGAIGFAYDPEFFTVPGEQNAQVVFFYKNKSPTSESWPLILFDEAEANIVFE